MSEVLFEDNIEKMEIWLRDHPDDVNITINFDRPVTRAVHRGNFPVVKFLIEKGANLSKCLNIASIQNDIEMMRLLLDSGCDIDEDIYLFVNIGARENFRMGINMYLLIQGYDWNLPIKYSMYILSGCVESGNIELAEMIIDYYEPHNFDNNIFQDLINSYELDDNTKIRFMQLLVDHGALIETSKPSENLTPNIIEYLLANGWNINSQDDRGNTILHLLIKRISENIEGEIIMRFFEGQLLDMDDLLRGIENINQYYVYNDQHLVDTALIVINAGIDQNIINNLGRTANDMFTYYYEENGEFD